MYIKKLDLAYKEIIFKRNPENRKFASPLTVLNWVEINIFKYELVKSFKIKFCHLKKI